MSDFVPRDILPDLWEEILQRHWTFLETEESMQKLEERKKLEACLKEFLCVVPHDRKFFLPETAHVLKKTVKELDDFNAFKAMVGFESISQYANNLFTKPWRKEYRIIKMYSGFYQHEIKSNLVDAEKLFEAMGYRQISNQILVLDGPICPDQVTNVSRDAMAAYVECQIMKQIKAGLTALPLVCSWIDIFKFRETHLGGASQAIKAIAYAEQERRFRAKKLAEAQFTSQVAPPPPPVGPKGASSCENCAVHGNYHHHLHPSAGPPIHQIPNGCNMRSQPSYNPPCTLHHPTSNMIHCKHPNYSQMSHSRSLEHYNEHSDGPPLPHRHSFDQPPQSHQPQHLYDNPYDCVESYQNACNFNAYNHPYNVSGNRYPLPYNISNQLNNHNQYAYTSSGNMYHPVAGCGHKIPPPAIESSAYGDCNGGYAKITPCNYTPHQSSRNSGGGKDFQNYRQRSFPPDHQLIDFEERPAPHELPHSHSRSQNNSFDLHDRTTQIYDNRRSRSSMTQSTLPSQKDIYSRNHNNHIESSDDLDGNYVYATPIPVKHRKVTTEKYLKNSEILQEYEKILDNKKPPLDVVVQTNGGSHTSHAPLDNFESFDDFVNVENPKGSLSDSTAATKAPKANKNQDGVGSFESWDYVFQNLEKHGYSKDLGERGDLLVQSLDLDSLNISAGSHIGTEKRRVNRNPEAKPRPLNGENGKSKTLEKAVPVSSRNRNGTEKSILKVQPKPVENGQVLHLKPSLKSSTKHLNNNFEEDNNHHQQQQQQSSNERVVSSRLSSSSSRPPSIIANNTINPIATQVIVTSPNEWSCRFCTFLNPDTKRVCEMCSKSKNLILESTNTPTCV
ncbi:protein tamozhennic [Eupeodes corollae]|uniref:protein tamozhennic n=1 Tax=Eupeodes corollae TaxID=290404 RepID=UPI002491AEA5|nr:protein tamozhennic [Eupeodes corollae]XP_055917343.1 protein tamozhennic [Eupeodes corollae]